MLGRKIIEVFPDENSLEAEATVTAAAEKDGHSLPVRRLRSAGLRIITENSVTSGGFLQVCSFRCVCHYVHHV